MTADPQQQSNSSSGPPDRAPRRVAITGIGCVTPIGIGADGLWAGLKRGRSAVRRITRFDPSPFRSHIAAQVDEFEPFQFLDESRHKRLDRYAQFAVASGIMALADAGLSADSLDSDRVGVQVGSALGGIALAEEQYDRFVTGGVRAVNPLLALSVFGGSASCNLAIEFGFTGPNSTNAMSCASGAMAIGEGWKAIRSGDADVVLAGGVEAPLSALSYGAFAILRAMSTRNDDPERASRPFDADRDGFVMGEGASILVLEEMESARRRRAPVYAELIGYGTTNDAHHMTAPRPDGAQAARAMRMALESAGVGPADVRYINAHASSTSLNDSTESRVIREVFGEHADRAIVSATKGYHAHSLGATGAIEAAITALAMYHGWIPPILNLETPGEDCDLPYLLGEGRSERPEYAISNSFGFGGINAALVFRSADSAAGTA